jgi:HEAT repeat protein
MSRWVRPSVVAVLIGIGGGSVQAQPGRPIHSPTTVEDLSLQLETCREGILDAQARADERRRWAELLLSYGTDEAEALVVELVSLSARPEVQNAVCQAVADFGRKSPDRLDAAFVPPLMTLLASDDEALRSAAARALAEFPGREVPQELAAHAARGDLPVAKRLAAIEALAANTHRRDVVAQLVGLLDLEVAELSERVASTLETIAPRSLGLDRQAWRAWWDEKSRLSEEQWLAQQLRVYRDRSRRLASELQAGRGEWERDQAAVVSRLRDFERELLRPLPPEQRDARLVEWIDDPQPAVKLAALGIVKARIADESKRPEGDVLAALVRLLRHETPAMRRESLQILQNLSDPSVLEAVLGRLEEEKDPALRQVVLQALGRLGNPAAVPALLREIVSATSPECLREAAIALGQIASKPESQASLPNTAETLMARYRSTPPNHVAVRAALLSAMAGVSDPAFAAEFASAVESDDAGVLQAALKGLRAVGDGSKVARCRTLMSHADPRVRLAAIEAVARLGREDADLETLLARVNAAVEPNELAREAAWRGCRQLLVERPVEERVRAIDRLREMPELAIRYMDELAASLAAASNNLAELDAVRDRLSAALVQAGRSAEAVPHLRELYAMRIARGDGSAAAVGLRWLEALLKSPSPAGCAELIVRLAETSDESSVKGEIVRMVGPYLEGTGNAEAPGARRLLAELRAVPADLLGDSWGELLARASANSATSREPGL